jgi:hypothetical protein
MRALPWLLGWVALMPLSGCVAGTDTEPARDATVAEATEQQVGPAPEPIAREPSASDGCAAQGACPGCTGRGPGFVDEDGDGVCDHRQAGGACPGCNGNSRGFVDEDGDGVCDHRQAAGACAGCTGPSPGRGFVDQDGDGVCDNLPRTGPGRALRGPPPGRGPGRGWGWRGGRGPGFVDQNGDGICDRRQ